VLGAGPGAGPGTGPGAGPGTGIAEHLGVGAVELASCRAEVADYDLDALTTAGRFWVHGTARHAGAMSPYSFFVKVVQSWTRSPQFASVPEPLREIAAASLPWRNEPAVHRSDLGARLPEGFSMPRAYAVVDLDDLSAGLWLQSIEHAASRWRAGTFARAAYLLGRLAASPPSGLFGVQLGERSADDLLQLEAVCLPAYHQGLSDEGCDVPLDALRRTHALLMLMFFGFTAVPLEVLFGAPAPGSATALRERARAASFVLDLVDSTTGT
jgi:hypothetical protein